MKIGFFRRFFMILGIIFFILIILITSIFLYFVITKPLGIHITKIPETLLGTPEITESSYDHPALTEQQEVFLENIGVDTEKLPTYITQEQEACAVTKLGQKRVDEIKAGTEPNTFDYLKAGSCFE